MTHIYFRVTFIFPTASTILAWIGYTGLGCVSLLFCLSLLRDIGIIISLVIIKIAHTVKKPNPNQLFNAQRRGFLFKTSSLGITALGAAVSGYGLHHTLRTPEIVSIPIRVKDKYAHMKGLKILQFSDLHVGPTIRKPFVKRVCDMIKTQHPDLIVFTGDLADGLPSDLEYDISPLKEISAPMGKYFVTGNHEYYSGATAWIKKAQDLGFKVLLNTHRTFQYNGGIFTLAGVTDIHAKNFFKDQASSAAKAFEKSPKKSFRILLAHQPKSVFQTAGLDVDLQLSGHTHGGQYFPFNLMVRLEHPFVNGLYQFQDTQVYVNPGTGYWGPPIRLGTTGEITLFTLV
ncbi:MAG: metallophosphoesterase [Desulfobacteraceae bacterium]|nr:metallophosphoesterase [Desulfobacteraceae bacterium]